jgi:hypothetical protein
MDASSHSGSGKRSILNALNTAFGVSDVSFASFGAGLFGARGARKIRSFAAQQCSTLFCFGFFRCNSSKPGLTNLFSGFFGSDILAVLRHHVGVTLHKMFALGKALKINEPVIRFIVVYVVDLFVRVKFWCPAFCHNTVNKQFTAQHVIAVCSRARFIRDELSKNFSAARNSVKMVKESIFDSVDYYAGHGVPFGAVTGNQVLT